MSDSLTETMARALEKELGPFLANNPAFPDHFWKSQALWILTVLDLPARDAEKWDEGHGYPCDQYIRPEDCREYHRNPYREAGGRDGR